MFAKTGSENLNLFNIVTIEGVDCVSHPISVVEAKVPNKAGGESVRSYFLDSERESKGLFDGQRPWVAEEAEQPKRTLRGFEKHYGKRKR